MSSNIIDIEPVTRIEGHAKVVLEVNEDGITQRAYFPSTSMVRGFEYLVRGRDYHFVNLVVQRICGICPIPHGLASAEAIEDAIDLTITKDARILRELLSIGNKLHSHALHQYLILPDIEPNDEKRIEVIDRIQEIRRLAQKMTDIIGGEAIHPSNIIVGGMRFPLTPYSAATLYRILRKCEILVKVQRDYMTEALNLKLENLEHPINKYRESMLASDMMYGNKNEIDFSAITEITPYRFYRQDEAGRYTNIMIPLYYGEVVEVGPRARFSKFKDYNGETPLHINFARAREMMILVYRALELLDSLNVNGPVNCDYVIKEGTGYGVIEAPRGTNIHSVTLDKYGTIKKYNMIVPTTWNMPTIERALIGNHHSLAELIIRSYDPCVECATHMIVVKDGKGKEIQRRNFY